MPSLSKRSGWLCMTWCTLWASGCTGGPVVDEAQEPYSTDAQTEDGVYVPADLDDALRALDGLLAEEARAWFRQVREEDLVEEHLGLALTLRNRWGLWGRSRLAGWFHGIGIDHPDDMSGIVVASYWRRVHGHPIDLAGQVGRFRKH